MKVYLAKDWTGAYVFAQPPVLMKCGGMPDIWSGYKYKYFQLASDTIEGIPRGKYVEREIWWNCYNIIRQYEVETIK